MANQEQLSSIYFAITIIVVLLIIGYFKIESVGLVYEKTTDEQFQLVRDLPDKENAAELMAEIKKRMQQLINYCVTNFPDNENVKVMSERFQPNNIQETSINDSGTSYTIDKGKEMHLCLRDKSNMELHNINILMFVAIHELAHVLSTSYGHNDEFGENFVFLLKQSIKIGIYNPVDYSQNPEEFCGMNVTSNPLY